MQIKINGLLLPKQAIDNQTVEEVYKQLKEEIYTQGKAITAVYLDNKMLPNDWKRREKLKTSVQNVSVLELIIDEPQKIKQRMLKDSSALIKELNQKTSPLARKFRIGDEVIANNDLAQFLEEINLIMNSLDHTTRGVNHLPNSVLLRQKVVSAATVLTPVLDRIYKAQAAGDYITIADELEYEFTDLMTQWSQLLEEVDASLNTHKTATLP